jgi:hypothetical protein
MADTPICLAVKINKRVTGITLPTLLTVAAGVATITVTGAKTTDIVLGVFFTAPVDTGLVQQQNAYVSAANTVTVPFFNPTGSTVTPAATVSADVIII